MVLQLVERTVRRISSSPEGNPRQRHSISHHLRPPASYSLRDDRFALRSVGKLADALGHQIQTLVPGNVCLPSALRLGALGASHLFS